MKLAYRADNSATSWTDLGADLDQGANILTKTGQSGTEYILGTTSSDNSLPVELSSFTARQEKSDVVLEWTTESEIENLGFILERKNSKFETGNWGEIASYITHPELRGQGSVTCRTEYQFTDTAVQPGMTYEYRLSDVSYDGVVKHHKTCKIFVKTTEESTIPEKFGLTSVYPNPFNPVTNIAFSLCDEAYVRIMIVTNGCCLLITFCSEFIFSFILFLLSIM